MFLMQILAFVNCRGIDDELNVIGLLFRSRKVTFTFTGVLVMQTLILTFGGHAFRLPPWGLGSKGWSICICFAVGSLVWSFLFRVLKEEKITCPGVSYFSL